MAEVKWSARRISDGVLVDVTGDTTGTPAGAPTANALEGGSGEQAVRLLGPFTLTYTAQPDGELILLATLDVGVAVLQGWAIVSTLFNQAPVGVQIGLADAVAYTTYVDLLLSNATTLNGPTNLGRDVTAGSVSYFKYSAVVQTGVQKLVAGVYNDGAPSPPTAGAISIYALIATPT